MRGGYTSVSATCVTVTRTRNETFSPHGASKGVLMEAHAARIDAYFGDPGTIWFRGAPPPNAAANPAR